MSYAAGKDSNRTIPRTGEAMKAFLARCILATPISLAAWANSPARAPTDDSIQRWDTYEITLHGPADSDKKTNPLSDLSFSATFPHQNDSLQIPGFYDGNGL